MMVHLITTLKFLNMDSEAKAQWLFREARRDTYFSKIIDDLQSYGYRIEYSWLDGNGRYTPTAIAKNRIADFEVLRLAGRCKAEFRIGIRHGAASALFYFMHELVHFKQDVLGRIHQDRSELEAEAGAKSIIAALHLKQSGYDLAWRGAIQSLNWRKFARLYERNLDEFELERQIFQYYNRSVKSNRDADYKDMVTLASLWQETRLNRDEA